MISVQPVIDTLKQIKLEKEAQICLYGESIFIREELNSINLALGILDIHEKNYQEMCEKKNSILFIA